MSGIYSSPCDCGNVYIRQTGHSTEGRIKEHHWPIRLYYLHKSAMAKHSIKLGHQIQVQDTSILAMRCGCMKCITEEVGEIKCHLNNEQKIKFPPEQVMEIKP
jgi:hypothetical protein